MTRAEFLSMAGALYDAHTAGGKAGTTGAAGRATGTGDGRAPKYDQKIFRKGGMCQYASELDISSLIYWRERAAEPGDPKYAEANAKNVKALDYWIAYRSACPDAVWSGERNKVQVTAQPPRDGKEAAQYPKDFTPGTQADAEASDPDFGDDDIPF